METFMEIKMNLRDCRNGIEIAVPKGYFMCWNFTTQAANLVKLKLYDDKNNIYLEETRKSISPEPVISGSSYMRGNQLYLGIDVPQSSRVEIRKNTWDITQGTDLLARSVIILAEDYVDNDFNDIQLNITAFKYKG